MYHRVVKDDQINEDLEYGTVTSKTVFEAPGTDNISAMADNPPPVITATNLPDEYSWDEPNANQTSVMAELANKGFTAKAAAMNPRVEKTSVMAKMANKGFKYKKETLLTKRAMQHKFKITERAKEFDKTLTNSPFKQNPWL